MNNIEEILNNFKREHKFSSDLPEDLNIYETYLQNMGVKEKGHIEWQFYNEVLFSRGTELYEPLIEREIVKEYPKDSYDIFGLSLKYIYAWDRLTWGIFGKVSSPELMLETSNDLDCSIMLVGNKFLKQSLQIIRNYCETCVAILYFSNRETELKLWYKNKENYYFPKFTDMLAELERQNIITARDRTYLREKYIQLNNSVHNKRNRLNMNFDKLDEQDRSAGFKDLDEWTKEINPLIKFMLILYIGLYEKNLLVPSQKKKIT